MYKFYNANSKGRFVNDCVVRAISTATGKSWDYTYNMLSDIAQEQGTMMDDGDFVRWYLDTRYERVPYLPYTVGEVAGEYPDMILLITMQGHITCSKPDKNGMPTIYDSFDCRQKIAEEAWIVKKSF